MFILCLVIHRHCEGNKEPTRKIILPFWKNYLVGETESKETI